MKRIILLFYPMFVVITTQAQMSEIAESDSVGRKSWYLDISVGMSQSKLSGSQVDYMQSVMISQNNRQLIITNRRGLDIGVLATNKLGKYFTMKMGLQFIQRGAVLENTGYVHKPTLSSTFIGIPILFGAHSHHLTRDKGFGLFVEGGLAYLINAHDNSNQWVTKTYSTLNVVAQGGTEYAITPTVTVGLRYKYMKDLTAAYIYSMGYASARTRSYDYFFTTDSFLASVRVKFRAKG